MTITIYGIKNCDTMKKAFRWLDENNIDHAFHDYKKDAFPEQIIKKAIKEHGWENVINRRGTTWRKLPDGVKNTMNEQSALAIAQENSSIIKRPLLTTENTVLLGFSADTYKTLFS